MFFYDNADFSSSFKAAELSSISDLSFTFFSKAKFSLKTKVNLLRKRTKKSIKKKKPHCGGHLCLAVEARYTHDQKQ